MRNDYTEYLMHKDHKYLSKEWVKGKWQYIYDEKLGGKAKRAYEKAKTVNDHDKTLLKLRNDHLRDSVINRNEAKNELYTNQKMLSKHANTNNVNKSKYDTYNKAVSDSSVKYADSVKKVKNAQSEYSEASNNESASDSKLKSAKNDYDKTALGKIDKMKSKGKNLMDKLLSKQNAKKNAAQKSAREEGMAERERQKTEANNLRASETRQNNQFQKAKADIRDANAAKRESGYGKEAVAKTEAERKQYLETRVKDIGKKRAEYENTLNRVVKSYNNEYIKALKGENNKLEESTSALQNALLLLSHTKALESAFQQNLKDASMYGNYNSNSYGDPLGDKNKVNDYLKKLEKEYHKLMG